MDIGGRFRDQLGFYGPIIFVIALIIMPVVIVILAFFHRPLFWVLAYFILLLACHFWIAPFLADMRLGQAGPVIAYTAATVLPVYLLTRHLHPWMVYPAVVVILLTQGRYWMTYLTAHQMYRLATSKDSHKALAKEFLRAQYDFEHRYVFNILVLIGFYVSCGVGFFNRWALTECLIGFAQYSILLLLPACLFILAKSAFLIRGDTWPQGLQIRPSNEVDRKKLNKMILSSFFHQEDPDNMSTEQMIDYFDRAGEIRKISYFSSIVVLGTFSAYGAAYTIIPNTLVSFSLKTLAMISVAAGLLLIHVPYVISQKVLLMRLTARFSGEEYRKIKKNLETESTSWRILGPAEILGASVFAPLSFWLIKQLLAGLNF